jgi:predicted metalloprotease
MPAGTARRKELMVKRWSTSLLALGAVTALLGACAQEADGDLLIGAPGGGGQQTGPVASDDPEAVVEAAIDDVSAFWRTEFPDVYGGRFEDLAGFYPYGPDTEPPPCGTPPPDYEQIADNAFYCPSDDIIAWDASSLIPELNENFGSFTVAIVIAHEFGHAIQARADAFDRSVDLELQADCFAGAWTARVQAGDATGFSPDDVDLDQAVAGIIAVRDAPGTSADDPVAHGSGFDRVAAFQDGNQRGAESCAPYADETVDRTTTELDFTDQDFETGGNLHLDDQPGEEGLLTLAETDLNEFYGWLFDELGQDWSPVVDLVMVDPARDEVECGGDRLSGRELEGIAVYCQAENIVAVDRPGLIEDLNTIGDFAVASELGQLWALDAQAQLGVAGADDADLQADCLTGVWAASTFPGVEDVTPDSQLQISAGDLDEAIIGFLQFGGAIDGEGRSAFVRTEALRTGVFDGYVGCEDYGPLA